MNTDNYSYEFKLEMVKKARAAEEANNSSRGLSAVSAAHANYVKTSVGEVRVLEYGFENRELQPLMIDMHGGGFIMNHADMDEKIISALRKAVPDCKFISIDYPKAPEAPFPAAVKAAYEVAQFYFNHAEELGIDKSRVVIGGHSAGGNLSAVTCMQAAETGDFSFKGQILDYPPLDLGTPAKDKPQPEGSIPVELADLFDACYLNGHDPHDPLISPVYADAEILKKLPQALVITCGMDSLGKEAKQYAKLLKDQGVSVSLYDYPAECHGFTYDGTEPANDAIAKMAVFLAKCVE